MEPPALQFGDVVKRFAARQVLGPISFALQGPGVVGLVGPNGAGKTTTLRLASGFFAPSSGTVQLEGRGFAESERELKCRLGYLPERPPLYPEMAVRDYLLLVGRLKRMEPALLDARSLALRGHCGLAEFWERRIAALSAGFRQRVGLAAALLPDPPLVLLDEPTSHLDPLQREEALALVRAEGARRTILLSSHLLSEVEDVCQRVLVLRDGKLVADGSPAELRMRWGSLRLHVRGPATQVCQALGALPGATSARIVGDQEGIVCVDIQGGADGSQAARAVLAAGWELLELSTGRGAIEAMLRGRSD